MLVSFIFNLFQFDCETSNYIYVNHNQKMCVCYDINGYKLFSAMLTCIKMVALHISNISTRIYSYLFMIFFAFSQTEHVRFCLIDL